jgi:ATP-dependent DNA helicase DinG
MTPEPTLDAETWRARSADVLRRTVSTMPHAEPRPGQAQMAGLVATTFAEKKHLVVEAGTGTGKSLAYLSPAACAGRPVVISTRTKALQNQLALNDVPLVAAVTEGFRHAVLKGRGNYVCLQKLDEALGESQMQFEGLGGDTVEELRRVGDWCEGRQIAEIDDVPFPLSPDAKRQLSAGTDECPGKKSCPRGEDCHAERARETARNATVVVVNHSLLAMALATGEPGAVIPPHELLVIDEAHELENAISEAFTVELDGETLNRFMRTASAFFERGTAPRALFALATRLDEAIQALNSDEFPNGMPQRLSKVLGDARQELSRLSGAVESIASKNPAAATRALRILRRITSLEESFTTLLGDDDTYVRYVRVNQRRRLLCATPINVGSFLRDSLWPVCSSVLTSATIPSNIIERLAIPARNVRVEKVESPFDYAKNTLFYVARGLPASGDRTTAVNPVVLELMEAAGGRTLALFTSLAAMRSAAEYCRANSRIPVLMQGEQSPAQLAGRFAADEATSLFATRTFFQGVDVPGRTLSLVIVDKLPFPIPTDPVLKARKNLIGSNSFRELDVVMCSTDLAQAAGRLVRRSTDTGMVALLDDRIIAREYGTDILNALPPMRQTNDRQTALEFLRKIDRR